jgi:hypothetical protein
MRNSGSQRYSNRQTTISNHTHHFIGLEGILSTMRNLSPLLLVMLLHCRAVLIGARRSSSYEDSRSYVPFGKWTVPGSERRRSAANGGSGQSQSSTLLMAVSRRDDDESHMKSSKDPVALYTGVSGTYKAHVSLKPSQGTGARLLESVRTKSRQRQPPAPTSSQRIQDDDSTGKDATESQDESSMLQAMIQTLIPKPVWDQLKGDEFQRFPDLLDGLSQTGEQLARQDSSTNSIDWKIHSSGGVSLEDGDVLVWTGKSLKEGYGSAVPWIKTRSIIPLAADEMVELLMDSSRVTTYNPWSMGRIDCWVADPDPVHPTRQTKIVKNRVQPPMGAKPAVSVTMLHARPVAVDGTWLAISRATGGNLYPELDQDAVGTSDILLGVNLIQPVDEDSCMLTAVTHAYSAVMPAMLAERLGVKGAIKFVKDIRALRVPAS